MDEELEKELDTLAEAEDYQEIVNLLKWSQIKEPFTLEQWLVPSLIKLGRYEEAEVELEQLSNGDPGTWWYLKSWIYYERDDLLDAREAIENAALLRKKEQDKFIDLSDEEISEDEIIALESTILFCQFSIWMENKEPIKVVNTILSFSEEKQNKWFMNLVYAYEELREWDKAEALLLSKINQGDDDPWNYKEIGEIIYKQGGRDTEALLYLKKACAADDDYDKEEYLARWISDRISQWHTDKEYERVINAVTEFEGNLIPTDVYCYIDSLIKLGRKAEAEEDAYALEAEARWDDTAWIWIKDIVQSWILLGHSTYALRVACALESEARWDDAAWCLDIVQMWYKLSCFPRALNLAQKAKDIFPEEAGISIYLIDSLINLDRKAEAEKAAYALEAEARWDDYFWCICVAQAWSLLHHPAHVLRIAEKAKKLFPEESKIFDGYMNCPIGYLAMHDSDKVREIKEVPKNCASADKGLIAIRVLIGK